MEVTVTLNWDDADENQKAGWLVFVLLPDEFIDKIFRDLDAEQRQLCIEGQTWGADLVTKHWDYIVETNCVIQFLIYQKLPPEFITSVWADVDSSIQTSILTTQKITNSLMEEIWDGLCDSVKISVLLHQRLPLESIFEKWAELTNQQLVAAFGLCWEGARGVNANLELDTKVLEFLTVMDQLRLEVATNIGVLVGFLPRLLTHTNEFVRAVAMGRMDRDMLK